ncbi:hypothetical protein [Haematobacter genomosp. 1]|uniref:Uncharacterized protein n=1 Tax=Haematobacter genomosp. 1 TaxID=366618 RepID=A0A212A6D1_9RHOB|nr:hypothetical protein [Haematobacter genomosp. 1]OWJ74610.1 hypothetical protein CDV49_19020 [Haematobacter genomosp. 1]
MTRREKQLFNRVQKLRKSRERPLTEGEIPVLIDYVRTMTRIEVLSAIFAEDDRRMRSNRNDAATKARLVATARQIDASTKLAHGMWERLVNAPAAAASLS